MTYFLISWATALKLGLFVYFCMQSWMVTLILTYWPTFLLVELQLWNLDHWCTFACRIEWWPRFWPSDLLSYYFSYSLETWTVCVFLHAELNGDLDFEELHRLVHLPNTQADFSLLLFSFSIYISSIDVPFD